MQTLFNFSGSPIKHPSGFSLIELLATIVILAILSATVLPKISNLSRDARISAVQDLEGKIRETQSAWRLKCATNTGCNLNSGTTTITDNGVTIRIWRGYPDAGETDNDIDKAIAITGFTVVATNPSTFFQKDGAPNPINCAVSYTEPATDGSPTTISTTITGC